jgi:hypothetical protein
MVVRAVWDYLASLWTFTQTGAIFHAYQPYVKWVKYGTVWHHGFCFPLSQSNCQVCKSELTFSQCKKVWRTVFALV